MEIQFTPKINFFIPSGGDCKECTDEEKLKKQQEASEATEDADRVTLSGGSRVSAYGDRVTLSAVPGAENSSSTPGEDKESGDSASPAAGPRAEQELSEEERQALEQLRARDKEVRAHEQAHVSAAGGHARGGPKFEYRTGPDGKRYAVGGEVSIDASPVPGDPQATIAKAQIIRRAANAPRNPSAQDRQVAAQATRLEIQARQELTQQRTEEAGQSRGKTESGSPGSSQAPESTDENGDQTASKNNDATPNRVIGKYTPSNTAVGDLLNVIS